MKGKFYLYLQHNVVPKGAPNREWEGLEYADFESAAIAAKKKVEEAGADEVQIFQLCGTAKKDIVIV